MYHWAADSTDEIFAPYNINESGEEEDDVEGCEYNRQLIVDYTKTVTCAEYSYSYAYRPDIVILSSQGRLKACIDDEMYDIRR